MIKKITVNGYKKFRNEPVVLDNLSSVNYIVGKNNSGKSSFLEVLCISTIGIIDKQDASVGSSLRDIFVDLPDSFNKDSASDNLNVLYEDENKNVSSYKVKKENDGRISASQNSKNFPKTLYVICNDNQKRTHGTDGNSIKSHLNSNGYLASGLIPDWVYLREWEVTNSSGGVGTSNKFKEFKELLKNIIGIEVIRVDKSARNNEIFFEYKEEGSSFAKKLYLLGSGARMLVNLFGAAIYFDECSIILVDEPEVHLYPSLERKLPEVFNELAKVTGKQFLVATQSPFLLANIKEKDNIYLFKEGEVEKIGNGSKIGKNMAIAMELGSDDPKAIGAPENYILLEESSLKIILDNAREFYGNKELVFISCSGNGRTLNIERTLKNIDEHNLLLKCNTIYSNRYFVVFDKIKEEENEKIKKLENIKKTIGERCIELNKESIEESYLPELIELFQSEKGITDIVNDISKSEYPESNEIKNELAKYISEKMTKEQFESMFPQLKIIFVEYSENQG